MCTAEARTQIWTDEERWKARGQVEGAIWTSVFWNWQSPHNIFIPRKDNIVLLSKACTTHFFCIPTVIHLFNINSAGKYVIISSQMTQVKSGHYYFVTIRPHSYQMINRDLTLEMSQNVRLQNNEHNLELHIGVYIKICSSCIQMNERLFKFCRRCECKGQAEKMYWYGALTWMA